MFLSFCCQLLVFVGVLLMVMCDGIDGNKDCWFTPPPLLKSICANVERLPNYVTDETMPYFMGDVLQHLLHPNDTFLQINDRHSSASYLSSCANRFSMNLSLRRYGYPAYSWPNSEKSRRYLPKAKYYYSHVQNVSKIPEQFEVLDKALKRLNYNASLILDYDLQNAAHQDMSARMQRKYGGALNFICDSSTLTYKHGIGVYAIGRTFSRTFSESNAIKPRKSIRNRRNHFIRGKYRPHSKARRFIDNINDNDDDDDDDDEVPGGD